MTRTTNSVRRTALMLGIALGAAAVTAPIAATPAEAFGLSDIGKAAKKVGGAVKDGGKFVGKAGVEMGKHAGKTAVRSVQGVRDAGLTAAGRVTYAPVAVALPVYMRATGQWNEENKQLVKDVERQWNDMFDGAGDKMDSGIRRVGQAAGEYITKGGVTSGESLPRPELSPEAKRRMESGLRDFANGGRQNRSMQTGLAKGGAFYNGRQGMTRKTVTAIRPVGGAKPPVQGITKKSLTPGRDTALRTTVVRDRSLTGRPIGFTLDGKKLPQRGQRPIQRPRPITAHDIKPPKPSRPFCNAKFENCSVQRPRPITKPDIRPPFCNSKFENCGHVRGDRHDHHGKKGRHSGHGKKWKGHGPRDKSVWGHPVGGHKKSHRGRHDNHRHHGKHRGHKSFSGGHKQRHSFSRSSSRRSSFRR